MEKFVNLLKVEGVNFKGFGIIPKLIMFDRNISLEAKAIYAFFASHAGNGTSSFPGRDYILESLKISKNAYYVHYNQLLEHGYIKVEKNKTEDGYFAKNVYILVSNPPNISDVIDNFNITNERVRFSGIKSLGYGMIPKAVLMDQRLSVKAKGIYAYFASYTGSGNSSFPKKQNILFHLGINESTYYVHYRQLIDCNYLTTKQRKVNGSFSVNDYFLVDNPDELLVEDKKNKETVKDENIKENSNHNLETPNPKNKDMDEIVANTDLLSNPKNCDMDKNIEIKIPNPKFCDMDEEDTENKDMENTDSNSNSFNSNSFNIIIPSFNKNKYEENEGKNEIEITTEEIEKDIKESNGIPYKYAKDENLMRKTLRHLTQYEYHEDIYQEDTLKNIYNTSIECLVDMLTNRDYTYYKGSKLSYSKILDMLNNIIEPENILSLTYFMESFVEKYIQISEGYEISSYESHLKSCMIQYFKDYKIEFAVNLNRIIKDI
ncbi:helix-turn-helix domain-containing protein [Tissierella pigra]|uniref:helix-turn-helix domain-containing protein n=1 Tax=Tissierella pigra TaxID=2607614 RepID=UPI001C10017F|nr:helix-turn-helix domain-containing protein [Tissierella pigra]MBU5428408.1 helix-turn-helix domain-containing protein [Tissierella pigra]